jgi:hypothetical protein
MGLPQFAPIVIMENGFMCDIINEVILAVKS